MFIGLELQDLSVRTPETIAYIVGDFVLVFKRVKDKGKETNTPLLKALLWNQSK